MNIPDVTGFTLGEAVKILKAAGISDITVIVTAPPKDKNAKYDNDSRVVRQRTVTEHGTEELTVCNMNAFGGSNVFFGQTEQK